LTVNATAASARLTTEAEGAGRAFLVGTKRNETNGRLAAAWRSLGIDVDIVPPRVARELMRVGDIAMGHLDVTPTLGSCRCTETEE
jgi:hypothetical protein